MTKIKNYFIKFSLPGMQKISKEAFDNLAFLVRLKFDEAEAVDISKDLESILNFVEKLKEIDTSKTPEYKSGLFNVWRADETEACDIKRDDLLKNAPEKEKGFIKVKAVLEQQ